MTTYRIDVNGTPYEVRLLERTGSTIQFRIADEDVTVRVEAPLPESAGVSSVVPAAIVQPPRPALRPAANAREVRAPMPGVVAGVMVKVGDTVQPGQPVIVLEAMKMENSVPVSAAGKVKEVLVKKGEEVQQGALLMALE